MNNVDNGTGRTPEYRKLLDKLIKEEALADGANGRFLEAWKTGVVLAGESFFDVKSPTVAEATDKDELQPRQAYITEVGGDSSHGQRVFLFALCSFFNHEWASGLSREYGETGNAGEMAAILDTERRQVIADLLVNYRGW